MSETRILRRGRERSFRVERIKVRVRASSGRVEVCNEREKNIVRVREWVEVW